MTTKPDFQGDHDPWICKKCGKTGAVQLGTQEKPYGRMIVKCPNGHEWRELMTTMLRAA